MTDPTPTKSALAAYQQKIYTAVREGSSKADTPDQACEWELCDPDFGTWETSCEQSFVIIDGSPSKNDMRFCCFCGLPVKEVPND